MTQEKDFIQSIRRNPNDDQLRQPYAEWLRQNGDTERSEFIRIKTLLEKAEADGNELLHRGKLGARGQELLKRNKERREQPLLEIGEIASTYSMGLPDTVFMSGQDFAAHGARLFELAPVSTLVCRCDTNEARLLAESPNLRNLTTLELAHNLITSDGARALADSPYLQSLTKLTLEGNEIGSAMHREIERTIKRRNRPADGRNI